MGCKMAWIVRLIELLARLAGDEEGAAMVEYTVLLALITVATIGAVTLVGGWVSGQWAALNADLANAGR